MSKQNGLQDFDQLFNTYKKLVLKIAYLMLDSISEAEDILQEVFTRVYKSQHSFDPQKRTFVNWLRRITVNECIKVKQKRHQLSSSLDELEQNGHPLADDKAQFSNKVIDKYSIEQLLNSLSDKYRAVLILKYFDDLPYSEIAQVLEIPLGTVKSRISEAISSLKKKQHERSTDYELQSDKTTPVHLFRQRS